MHCTAATFYSVSISNPIPVWFGKYDQISEVKNPKPNPVWFGNFISTAKAGTSGLRYIHPSDI